MTQNSATPKIQPLLAALLARYRSATAEDRTTSIQIAIQIRSEADAESVRLAIANNGGEVVAFRKNELESKLPVDAIEEVAAMEAIVNIRLARVQTIR